MKILPKKPENYIEALILTAQKVDTMNKILKLQSKQPKSKKVSQTYYSLSIDSYKKTYFFTHKFVLDISHHKSSSLS